MSEAFEKAEKEFNLGGGEYFKVKEGSNKIRVISEWLPHNSLYNGQPTFKWLCQVIDRANKEIKVVPYFMPNKIYKSIMALQLDPDYGFEALPMPYDITITAKNAGQKTVEYHVIPAPVKELTGDEIEAIAKAPSVQELQKKVRDKQEEKDQGAEKPVDSNEVDVETIPF